MFQLAFHLPYYAWRSTATPRYDHRRFANGDHLRHVQDISFLDWDDSKGSNRSSYLYESQISCVVAGSDNWTWVAYCFVDTYFDMDDKKDPLISNQKDSHVAG